MEIKHTDEHTIEFIEHAAYSFMTLLTHDLNFILKQNGVSEKNIREKICSDYLFELAYDFDACWFIEGKRKLFTKVCFAERAKQNSKSSLGEIETLHLPTEAIAWHEFILGVVEDFFEGGEKKPKIKIGSYDNEN